MDPSAWIAAAVGVTVLLGAIWRLIKAGHRFANSQEHMAERIGSLERSLNNGIRSDIRQAKERSERAAGLAADAARTASLMQQRQEDISRSVNALRSEVDIYTNVVLTDRQRIRHSLREAGIDLPDDEE